MKTNATPKPRYHAHRAARAEAALDAYQKALGEGGPHYSDRIRDLLQDLLHWMTARTDNNPNYWYGSPSATLRNALREAVRDFPRELAEPDEPANMTTAQLEAWAEEANIGAIESVYRRKIVDEIRGAREE